MPPAKSAAAAHAPTPSHPGGSGGERLAHNPLYDRTRRASVQARSSYHVLDGRAFADSPVNPPRTGH
jgi:hypothetical protein